MNSRSPLISILANLFVFLVLEAFALFLVYDNSIIQRSQMMNFVNTVIGSTADAGNSVTTYFSLKRANEKLLAENSGLRKEIWEIRALLKEQEDIDSIPLPDSPYTFIPVRILSNTTDRLHNVILIDKGKADGIREEMGIITEKGIVGYVQNAGKHYSRVVSLLDTENAVSARIKRNNAFGILKWDGKNIGKVILNDIPIHTEFSRGDTVTSSGYSAVYPPHIPLGTIIDKYSEDGINYSLVIRLFESYNKLEHAYAVVVKDIDEINAIMKKEEGEENAE